jgi:hypothetical protein
MRQVKARLLKLNGLYGDDSDDSVHKNSPINVSQIENHPKI